mmetsp:Transcript_30455/g.73986  ORF Transcript_30455/g.73986 Transcript_30455/m.73986 type:complete len:136 (-) Transcript_30455:164-571(-)|eukprot:CAMPEP_0113470434 /NCGR_PEP_ID=MMETSP0014_2-20120614/16441_1 /TAXON_ID=2857 /ORGANISM="Nitzschia sp." /LENGTH=135 /DNA_ID=CAMNT_0000362999 /DNA_START=105 /DNA_END=512 /DNA_ORIENTATION=- /assembly_acc=CAM_ASM_000159
MTSGDDSIEPTEEGGGSGAVLGSSRPSFNKTKKKELLNERNELIRRLKESGQYERLRQELYARLLLDDDWKEVIQRESREVLHNDNNEGQPSQVTLDELSAHLFQHGLESVPDSVVETTKLKIREACRDMMMDRR